jgi:hypothetical protein
LQAGGFDPASVEVGLVRQSLADSTGCWFIDSGSLLDGQTGTQYVRVGSASPATDNAQILSLGGDHTTMTTVPGAGAIQYNGEWEVLGVTFSELPGSTLPFARNFSTATYGWSLKLTSTGAVQFVTGRVSGSDVTSTTPATLSIDTAYDIKATVGVGPSYEQKVYIDNVLQVTTSGGGMIRYNSLELLQLISPAGYTTFTEFTMARPGIPFTGYTFTPSEITLTQEGSAGNAWAWIQTIEDTVGSKDATISFTRDLTGVTVEAGALQDTSATAFADITYNPASMVGTLPGLNVTNATSVFTGDDDLDAIINFTGLTSDGGYFGLLVLIASMLGAVVVAATKQPALGVGILGASVGVGGVLGWFGFLYVVVGLVMCFGIAGSAALLGKK